MTNPALSIYAELASEPSLAASSTAASVEHAPRTPVAGIVSSAAERTLLAILDAPAQPGETLHAAYRRKERELGTAFAGLAVSEARALSRRLTTPRADDALALKFSRLVADRRGRLLAFLGDARRREALARMVKPLASRT